MKDTPSIFELSRFITCERCGAKPAQSCRTATGHLATWPHAARLNTVTVIWTEGFIDGQLDAVYAPEVARRWLTKDGYLAADA